MNAETKVLKMATVAEKVEKALAGKAPHLNVKAADGIMSCVSVTGSFDAKETWENNIFHNSRYFIVHVTPANGKRWYDEAADANVTLEAVSLGHKVAKLRKFTGAPDKAVEKLVKWIDTAAN